ncbi:MAG: type II toxin-antitoxin system HicB family antitoxin [Chloroflexota bacterium]|nr:type II toxin-antitoxin system HicB family antitoxin [Chloroflexota bacterium]
MKYRVVVVLEKPSERNYSAYALEVPGCVATGKTKDQTLKHMQEALQLHLEAMLEDGEPMPEDEPIEAHVVEVEVATPAVSIQGANSKAS